MRNGKILAAILASMIILVLGAGPVCASAAYTVTVNPPTGGAVTVSPSQATYSLSSVVTITASADPGYKFLSWSATGGTIVSNTSTRTQLTVKGNVTLSASFVQIHYPLTVHQSTGGAVILSPSLATYTYSQTGTLTATATTSYNFVSWSVTGGSVDSNTSSQTVLNVTSTCSVTASYHKITYSDTLTDIGSGTIRLTPSNGPYYLGTVVSLTASANAGWKFVSWSNTGGAVLNASSSKTSLTVDGNFDLTANFSALTYGVSGVASPAADGSVSVGSATGTIGQVVSISQTANPGYGFIGWKLNDGGHGAKFNSGSASITLGSSNVTVTASYVLLHYPVTVHQTTGGAVTFSPSRATYTYSQTGTLTATTSLGYSFVDWVVTGGSVASGTSSKTALTVTGTCSVTASFNQLVYNSTLTDVAAGTAILSNSGPYTYGQVITATAFADSDYAFKGWLVSGSITLSNSASASTSLTVYGNFTLTPSYAYIGSLTTLYSFTGSDGAIPFGDLTLSGSILYGMNSGDGTDNFGTIFSIPTSGGAPTILYSFSGANDGASPYGDLTISGSTMYGMTSGGGAGGVGTIFSIPTSGGMPTTLYSFSGNPDGALPLGSLILSGSTLYGMTDVGGDNDDGTIFSIPTSGGTPTILYSFSGADDGANPNGSLTLSGSTLYGMTSANGAGGQGTVFSLPTSGDAPTILYSFSGAPDGALPFASLTLSGSTLYGMTSQGGADNQGIVFSLPTSGGALNILCAFDGTHGAYPGGSLALSGSTLYGMTNGGGLGTGTVFRLPVSGGMPTILFSFDGDHGSSPFGSLALSGSTLYGMTVYGGDLSLNGGQGYGTVFSLPITSPLQYTLAVTPPTGGTVTVSPDQATYSPSALVAITAQANTGSNFVSWSVTGGTVALKTASQTLLTVTGNVTLSASFHMTSYSDTLTDVGGGKIQMTPSHGPYFYGTVVGLTASANTGWQFVSWSATEATLTSSDDITTSLTVLGNFDLTANFSAIIYCVSGLASPTAGGTVSVGSATGTIGRVISISRTTNPGYSFTGWTLNDGGHGAKFNSGSASITLGSSNVTVTANYTQLHYPVTVHQSTGGVVTLTPTQATYTYSQTGTLTATATTSYNFVSWSVTGGSVNSNTSSQTVLNVTGTCSVTASYHKIVYSDTLADVGGGTIRLTPSHGPYYLGTVVGLTASPSPGWQFVSWSTTGGSIISASSATTSFTVDGNFDLTATFAAITYGVSGVAGPVADGTVSVGSATGTIGQVVSISQTANAGYGFTGWKLNDGGHGAKFNSGSASITLGSSNVTVTASYALSHYPVVVHQSTGGHVTLSPSQATYTYSQTGTLTATTSLGYNFVNWSVTGGSAASNTVSKTTLTVTGPCSVTPSYHEIVYSSTFANLGDGSIILSSSGPYTYGQEIAAAALAESEYSFKGWTATGSITLSNSATASIMFTVHGDFTLTASYAYTGLLNTLCSFTGTGGDCPGAYPEGSLTLSGSTLFGMTPKGGADDYGTIFSIPTTGGSPTVLYSFTGSDAAQPYGTLFLSGSTLFGMTAYGGSGFAGVHNSGYGTVFSLPITGGTPTILCSFDGTHAASPNGSLTLSGSTLYGMTTYGGSGSANPWYCYGTVFSLPTSGGSPTILCTFTGSGGSCPGVCPFGSLTLSGETLFGMTSQGGADYDGTIFSLPITGGTPTILCSFTGTGGACPGANPFGSLTLSGSSLYGMTEWAGANGAGEIFRIPTTGGTPTILCAFDGIHGRYPYGDLTLSGSNLYGMTYAGGNMSLDGNGAGTVFRIPTSGGSPTILFSFDGLHGLYPVGYLTLSGSTLYGQTSGGGTSLLDNESLGTVFSLPVTTPLQYTLTVTQKTGGTVDVTPIQASYTPNAVVAIRATPNSGFSFTGWTVTGGTVTSATSAETLLTVTGNVTLSATFK